MNDFREFKDSEINFYEADGELNVNELLSHPALDMSEDAYFDTPVLVLKDVAGKEAVGTVTFGNGSDGIVSLTVKLQKDSPERMDIEAMGLAVNFGYEFDGNAQNGKFVISKIVPTSATLTYDPKIGDSDFLVPSVV